MTGIACFRSMGCDVLVAGASVDELARIEALFTRRDATFSRFVPGSELNRVNARAGRATTVSAEFAAMVQRAMWAAEQTGGLVDPTLGRGLVGAGYDRDFPLLADDGRPAGPSRPGCWKDIRTEGRMLWIPPGTLLDLSGVVKSATADDALGLLGGSGWVSAGGDVVAGREGVDVALPAGGEIRVVAGAVATSGVGKRRWTRRGRVQHHILDPATGCPARTCWEQVTVSGATCLIADVAAKAALVCGQGGPAWLERRGLPGRFLRRDGCSLANGPWIAALQPVVACT